MIFSTSCSENRSSLLLLGGFLFLSLCACATVRTTGNPAADRLGPLQVTALFPDRKSPQAAETTKVCWEVRVVGGEGQLTYTFVVSDGTGTQVVRWGRSPSFTWRPAAAGNYRVSVMVKDAAGNVAESGWSDPYEVVPKLVVESLVSDRDSPQAAEISEVRWEANSAGGVGSPMYAFVLSDGTKEQTVQDGPSPSWAWRPDAAGNYRVMVVARDAAGNVAESGWSDPYEVVPKLVVESLVPDRDSPQAAEITEVHWEGQTTGGVGSPTYTFVVSDGTGVQAVRWGRSPSWAWRPETAGNYRVNLVARDAAGNVVERSWASVYEISPKFEREATVAVMPMENLTGTAAPMRDIQAAWIDTLKGRGVRVLEDQILEEFMARHRIRYTGGMTKELGESLRMETGARGVLFTSLDLYDETSPPKIALTARLVYAGKWAGILWMDSIAIAGNDSPGILGIGLVNNPVELRGRVMARLADSLEDFLSGKKPRKSSGPLFEGGKKFRPKTFYGSPEASAKRNGPLVVAVLPFQDESRRRHIGEIMMLQFVRHLSDMENVEVVEPGVVRNALLTSRTIMEKGLSIPQSDLLREILHVHLVIEGWVKDYYDYTGPVGSPKVRFSTEIIDTERRQVTWSALSYGQGSDGVFFFGAGMVNTAHVMASRMVQEVLARIMRDITGPKDKTVTKK